MMESGRGVVRYYQQLAEERLCQMSLDYCQSGTDEMNTVEDNLSVLQSVHLKPLPVSKDPEATADFDLSTTVLGQKVALPLGIAPSAYHSLFTDEGEVATALAARTMGICYTQSLFSSISLDDVTVQLAADGSKGSTNWLQLYILPDWSITSSIISKAEHLGYKALVVTGDLPVASYRRANLRLPFQLPAHLGTPNLDPFMGNEKLTTFYDPRWDMSQLTWDFLRRMRQQTHLPIVLKGVLSEDDAVMAHDLGIDALWVSNHGGRALDASVPSALALVHIRRRLSQLPGRQMELYMDGGVRSGGDVLKCMALGARAVFIGRPVLWALACGGQSALEDMLQGMKEEFIGAMGDLGVRSIAQVSQINTKIGHIRHKL